MRGLRAKSLMKMARAERANEKDIAERDLVLKGKKSDTVVNHPYTIRAMYLALKRAYKRVQGFAGEMKAKVQRKPRPTLRTQRMRLDKVATIENPLMLILHHNTVLKKDGTVDYIKPEYFKARHLANRGDGAAVKRMAAAYA